MSNYKTCSDCRVFIIIYNIVSDQSGIEDVYDGTLDKALMKHGSFLTNPHNIKLPSVLNWKFNTDGVSLFHYSNNGMWPIYLKINEHPVKIRSFTTNKVLQQYGSVNHIL